MEDPLLACKSARTWFRACQTKSSVTSSAAYTRQLLAGKSAGIGLARPFGHVAVNVRRPTNKKP